jgi:hypothetical protein
MCTPRIHIVIAFTALLSAAALAQEMPVPVNLQHALLMKVLAFDRNLISNVDGDIVIGIVHQRRFRASLNATNEFVTASENIPSKIRNLTVRYHLIDISNATDIKQEIVKHRLNVLYVAPLRAVDIEKISSVAQTQHILTLTGVLEYVEAGLAVGIGLKGEKPEIVINLTAARAEGADFTAQLLGISRVIN